MGWVLTSAHHGKGYATEGVRAALAWADEHLRTERTVCLINPDNAASIRVAEKAGYDQTHRTTFNKAPTLMFEARPNRELTLSYGVSCVPSQERVNEGVHCGR